MTITISDELLRVIGISVGLGCALAGFNIWWTEFRK